MFKRNKSFSEKRHNNDIGDKQKELLDEYNEEEFNSTGVGSNKIIKIIIFVILIVLIVIIVDCVAVKKYDHDPYFAVLVKTYNDGGTKVYYGLGYKVISYNQVQGRQDKVIGTWGINYNTKPITIEDVDLAIDNKNGLIDEYNNKFIRIVSSLKKNNKNNIIIGYTDKDKKYSIDITCIPPKDVELVNLKEGGPITVIGTFRVDGNKLIVKNCFAEQ